MRGPQSGSSAIYDHPAFEALYPQRGKPAEVPWRLALITVMQFAADLSDRAAAEAVRSHIDWPSRCNREIIRHEDSMCGPQAETPAVWLGAACGGLHIELA